MFYRLHAVSGGQLLFRAETPLNGFEPWVTDGTPTGTNILLDIESGPGDGFPLLPGVGSGDLGPIGVPGGFYFTGYQPATGNELWFSDGTSSGTSLVADIQPGSAPSDPDRFLFANGDLYLEASAGLTGSDRELYRHVPGTAQFDLVDSEEFSQLIGFVGGFSFTSAASPM